MNSEITSYIDQSERSDEQSEAFLSPTTTAGSPAIDTSSSAKLLLMGLRRSGKSSIQNVVFHKMAPMETLYLESSSKITSFPFISFINFSICDFPGQIDFFDPDIDVESIFSDCGALVYIIDALDDYLESLQRLFITVTKAYKVNPELSFEVLIHKVDGLSDDSKIEIQRDINQRLMDELSDADLDHIHLSFYLTSIYDHSIYESFSKIIQKLIPSLPTLENLLNILCSNSGIEKAFLFDVSTKIYVATDSSPVDIQSYELCADMIDVFLDVSSIYDTQKVKNDVQQCIIKLTNGMVLYAKGINKTLSLVCLLREDNFEKCSGVIDYNFLHFKDSVLEVFNISKHLT